MKVLMLSTDRKLFDAASTVRTRMIRLGAIVDELHIVVLALAKDKYVDGPIAPNVFVYSTNSVNRYLYPSDAVWKGRRVPLKPDLITAQDPFECGLAGWFLSKIFGAPLELQVHTDFASPYFKKESGLNRIRTWIAKITLPRASHIRVVSERIRKSILARGITVPITVLPVFVDVHAFSDTPPAFSLRAQHPDFTFLILMLSRLTPEKDYPTALVAAKQVMLQYPKTGLVIVGDGFKRADLEADARGLGIAENVVFTGWQSDTISYYKGASMFLLTSQYEGYGQVLVEAAAAGCPIVTTDVGIAGDILKDGVQALVAPVGASRKLAEHILAYVGDNNLRRKLAVQAKEDVLEKAPKNVDEYLLATKNSWQSMLPPSTPGAG